MKSTADMILIDSFTTSRVCLTMERKRSFSITYSPSCDLASLKSLKNVMMDQNNFPRSSFQTVMASYKVNLLFGLVSVQPPCTETYNPPTIQNPIPTITIRWCNPVMVPVSCIHNINDARWTVHESKLDTIWSFVKKDINVPNGVHRSSSKWNKKQTCLHRCPCHSSIERITKWCVTAACTIWDYL